MGARQWIDVKPCGTPAAYRRHIRRGEKVDQACREAELMRWRDAWRRRNPNRSKRKP